MGASWSSLSPAVVLWLQRACLALFMIFRAALIFRSMERPQTHSTHRSANESSGKIAPHELQVFDVLAGFTRTTDGQLLPRCRSGVVTGSPSLHIICFSMGRLAGLLPDWCARSSPRSCPARASPTTTLRALL